MKKYLFLVLVMGFVSCASESLALKEEIRFLMDKREYTKAIEKARLVVANDSDDTEGQFLLASALIGGSVLGGNSSCPAGDDGLLGLLACLADPLGPNENDLSSFLRVAPELEKIEGLEEATDILLALDTLNLSAEDKDNNFIRLYAARLFELAGALTRVGLKTENVECNYCLVSASDPNCVVGMKDQVADGFDANALTTQQRLRFRDNITSVNDVGSRLGLSQDFSLIIRAEDIALQLGLDPVPIFFDFAFNDPATLAICDQPL